MHPHTELTLSLRSADLDAALSVPEAPTGYVVVPDFGSAAAGVARRLAGRGVATLRVELTGGREQPGVEGLAERLLDATAWLDERRGALPLGYLAAGDGAAAAVWAAAELGGELASLVSVHGRLEPVASRLGAVQAPALLVAGERELPAVRRIRRQLGSSSATLVVRGGAQAPADRIAKAAGDWFARTGLAAAPARYALSRRERRALARRFQALLEDQVREQTGRSPRRLKNELAAAAAALALIAASGLNPLGAAASVTSSVNPGTNQLDITTDAGEDLVITCEGGNVKISVNGGAPADPGTGPAGCATIAQIRINPVVADAGANQYDMSQISAADFTALTGVSVLAGGGSDTLVASSLPDTLDGGAGTDVFRQVTEDTGADSVRGGADADTLVGTTAAATLAGQGDGTSTIDQGGTVDTLTLVENITLTGTAGGDSIDASGLNTTVLSISPGAGNDTVRGGTSVDTIVGSAGDDSILGSAGADALTGDAGNDTIGGEAGNDSIIAGAGSDSVGGGPNVDSFGETLSGTASLSDSQLVAGAETDSLSGLELITLTGGAGADSFDASASTAAVTMIGSGGTDTLIGGSGGDSLQGGAEADDLRGNAGQDALTGAAGPDLLAGGAGADTLTAGDGADTLEGGADTDNDDLSGGLDSDLVRAAGSQLTLTNAQLTGLGTDALVGIEGASLTGTAGSDTLDASAADIPATLAGGDSADTLSGGTAADDVAGGDGADALAGGDGTDSLTGDAGDDAMVGAAGDDTLAGGDGTGDRVAETGDADFVITDTALTGAGTDALSGVEGAVLSGTAADSANTLDASGFTLGAVTLGGGGGDDTLAGSSSSDSLDGGAGSDRVARTADASMTLTDTQLAVAGADTDALADVERASLTGGAGANTLDASGFTLGAVSLAGGDGSDSLLGGSGADSVGGDAGDDTVTGGAGDDTLGGGDGTGDRVAETADADLVPTDTALTGAGSDALSGIEGAVLSGTAADSANTLDASGFTLGAVTLAGGGGDDTLLGSSSGDSLDGGTGSDRVARTADASMTLTDGQLAVEGADTDSLSAIERASLTGGAGAHRLDASGFDDPGVTTVALDGAGGDDSLLGSSSADATDSLTGGTGSDELSGNGGSDAYAGGDGDTDVIVEQVAGQAVLDAATLTAIGTTATHAGIEAARLTGTGDGVSIDAGGFGGTASLTGTAGADALTGTAQADSLDGGAADDVLTGGAGGDSLAGGTGTDAVRESGDTDATVTGTADQASLTGFGGDGLTGVERVELTGGAGANALDASGFSGRALLTGGDGADSLTGGSGDDVLAGGADGDSLTGNAGADDFSGGAGADELKARDGVADAAIACGDDSDTAEVDAEGVDAVAADCETVNRPATDGGTDGTGGTGGSGGGDQTGGQPGGGQTGGGTQPAADVTAPRLRLGNISTDRRGIVRAVIECDEACAGTYKLVATVREPSARSRSSRTRQVVLGRGRISQPRAGQKVIRIKLSRRNRALIDRVGVVRGTLTVNVRDAAGNRAKQVRKLRIRGSRRR
jgi:Ca2+-binding RTX toxin-like protein